VRVGPLREPVSRGMWFFFFFSPRVGPGVFFLRPPAVEPLLWDFFSWGLVLVRLRCAAFPFFFRRVPLGVLFAVSSPPFPGFWRPLCVTLTPLPPPYRAFARPDLFFFFFFFFFFFVFFLPCFFLFFFKEIVFTFGVFGPLQVVSFSLKRSASWPGFLKA